MIRSSTLVVVALLSVLGCTSITSVKDKPLDAGNWQEFGAPADTVTRVARESIQDVGLKLVEEYHPNPSTTVLLAERGMSDWSSGEIVRVAVDDKGPSRSSVRVVSERKLKTNVTATDFAPIVISKMASKLGR